MAETLAKQVVEDFPFLHNSALRLARESTDEQFAQLPSPTAPPIGWHLFHIARWADRLQASFPNMPLDQNLDGVLPRQFWIVDNIPSQWNLDPKHLGWLEMGAGMSIEEASNLMLVGKDRLIVYAEKSANSVLATLETLEDGDLMVPRNSILPRFDMDPTSGKVFQVGPRKANIMNDLHFYCHHLARHLGMIEALRGVMFSFAGTATI